MRVIGGLPQGQYAPSGAVDVFKSMVGARIVRIGSTDEGDLEGGGLVVDFVPVGEKTAKRVVFSFNERGMWVEWEGEPSNLAGFPQESR